MLKRLFGLDSPPTKKKRPFLQQSFTVIKTALSSVDPPTKKARNTGVALSDTPIDLDAFSITNSGNSRKGVGSDKATRRAVQSRVDALTADNDDQNFLLALWKTTQHPRVRNLFQRLRLYVNSDEVRVGARLLRGIKRITSRIKENMKSSGRSKDC